MLRKVTLPGVSHRGDYRWAEVMRGLNISRISVKEPSWCRGAGQNPSGPIPQVVPLPVLSPPQATGSLLRRPSTSPVADASKPSPSPELLVALQI